MSDLKNRYLTLENKLNLLKSDLQSNTINVNKLKDKLMKLEECQTIIQKASKDAMESVKDKVTEMSSDALTALTGKPYTIKITFQTRGKQNQTMEADLKLVDEHNHETDMMRSSGGGLRDTVSLLLRLSLHSISEPRTRSILILDEPLKNLSEGMRELGGELLRKLSEELNMQIIMTTNEYQFIDASDMTVEVIKGY